jgi:hypothetical protein
MILPAVRDPRFVTVGRGGTLTDADHRLLALWAAACAEHVVPLFEPARPQDPRPRQAIVQVRAWVRGEVTMMAAGLQHRQTVVGPPGGRSAGGSAIAFRMPSVISFSTISGCATTCAGQYSSAEIDC